LRSSVREARDQAGAEQPRKLIASLSVVPRSPSRFVFCLPFIFSCVCLDVCFAIVQFFSPVLSAFRSPFRFLSLPFALSRSFDTSTLQLLECFMSFVRRPLLLHRGLLSSVSPLLPRPGLTFIARGFGRAERCPLRSPVPMWSLCLLLLYRLNFPPFLS